MIMGTKINAQVTRSPNIGNTNIQILPSPPTIPSFTVRKFMGEVKQTVRPFPGTTSMFGVDIEHLRCVFADWPTGISTNKDFPVKEGDILVIPGDGSFPISGARIVENSHLQIYISIAPTSTNS